MSTWQQVKQQEAITISTPKPASIYFQTKPFVKASTKEGTVKVFVVNLEIILHKNTYLETRRL